MKSKYAVQHLLLREHFLKEISEGVLFSLGAILLCCQINKERFEVYDQRKNKIVL